MTEGPKQRRQFLILQGLATPFLFRLAGQLRAAGHGVTKVHLCGADLVFWPGRAVLFRAGQKRWPAFFRSLLRRKEVTDLILFGDCRPYHRIAVAQANASGIAVHVLEEGYVRPGFITLEQGGSNGYSRLPREPEILAERARTLTVPAASRVSLGSFGTRAAWDVLAQTVGLALTPLFPHYRWHGPVHPFVEYGGFLSRFARAPWRNASSRRTIDRIFAAETSYFLVPLQLDSDYQIRVHSPYRGMLEAVEDVLASFARSAPPDSLAVFKLHPLDPGLVPYGSRIRSIARRHGVTSRVRLVSVGHLADLIVKSSGVVLVNSTVGITALQLGQRVKTLGQALYDIPGLCFAGSLDAFWTADVRPDRTLLDAFMKVLMFETQVEGDFFSRAGVETAARNAAERILCR